MIYVHLAKGFEEIEALTCVDLLRRAGLPVETVSCDPARTVTGSHGISVEADTLFVSADYDGAEMIVLPGGMPGTTNLRAHEKLCQKIREFAAAEDKKVAAICAAPMILGQLGLLEGKKATIYPGMEEELKGAKTVLTAAALTYVAGVASTLFQMLRLILVYGRRRDNR